MKSAYNHLWVYNLTLLKEAKRWAKHDFIQVDQLKKIQETYRTPFYHPNIIIRILLLVATLLALLGVTGLVIMLFADVESNTLALVSVLYGIGSFVALEKLFIQKHHFKSGVTEALIYHSCGFTIGGIVAASDMENISIILLVCLLVFAFAAIRYLDLITTLAAVISLAGFIFYLCFEAEGIISQIVPFTLMIIFSVIYFIVKKINLQNKWSMLSYNFLVLEMISLLIIYMSGNYLVVRELSVQLMDLNLEGGQDIPFAFLFYFFTVAIPIVYLWIGIKTKDIMMLRLSLFVLAFTVFTFKYYYSLGHPEITLTLAGTVLILIAIALTHYLKIIREGFTRDNLMTSKWASHNVEGILISQTMGGNEWTKTEAIEYEGGDSGGGGATSSF